MRQGAKFHGGTVLNLASEARFSATFSYRVNCLRGNPAHQGIRFAGGVD